VSIDDRPEDKTKDYKNCNVLCYCRGRYMKMVRWIVISLRISVLDHFFRLFTFFLFYSLYFL